MALTMAKLVILILSPTVSLDFVEESIGTDKFLSVGSFFLAA
jgi:hypothetical protein